MLYLLQISKLLLLVLFAFVLYFIWMDVCLYIRIRNYPIDRGLNDNTTITDNYGDHTWVGCSINPLCDVTVKAVLLDHVNYYLFAPLVTITDQIFDISHIKYITPNSISVFHVFVAILSAKCISSDSLSYRRLGVLLFEVRTFLDDFDGHVARVRKHVKGERSEIGSPGYYVDGICDAIGCTALIIGAFIFLKNNPPRRGYMQLPTTITNDNKETGIIYKSKITSNKVLKKLFCLSLQQILSSMAWNRYIALYQDMLENNNVNPEVFVKQNEVFKSSLFFMVGWLWRVVNVHNMVHCMLLAVFCDKLWEFLKSVQYLGFGVLLFIIGITEVHMTEVRRFIFFKSYSSNGDKL